MYPQDEFNEHWVKYKNMPQIADYITAVKRARYLEQNPEKKKRKVEFAPIYI